MNGCTTARDPTTFRIAVRKFDAFERHMAEQWRRFQAATGTTLRLDAVPMDLHDLHTATFASGGLRSGQWDVAYVCSDWLGEAHAGGDVLDLAPALRQQPPEDYPQGWSDSLLRHQRFGDAVYGLPHHDGPECLIYRRDLFDDPAEQAAFRARHGRPLALPATWEDFHAIARFFTRPAQRQWGTIIAGYPDGHNTVYDWCLQIWSRGGEAFTPEGRPLMTTPQAHAGLAYYRQLLRDGAAIHPESAHADSVTAGLAFARGEVAMMVNWFGFAALADADPHGPTAGKAAIGVIPGTPGVPRVSLNVYWLLGVGRGSPHADLAYRFVRHCASPAADRALTLAGAIGCRRSTWNDPTVVARTPAYAQMETLHRAARELPRHPRFAVIASAIDALVLDAVRSDTPIEVLCQRHQTLADQAYAGVTPAATRA